MGDLKGAGVQSLKAVRMDMNIDLSSKKRTLGVIKLELRKLGTTCSSIRFSKLTRTLQTCQVCCDLKAVR